MDGAAHHGAESGTEFGWDVSRALARAEILKGALTGLHPCAVRPVAAGCAILREGKRCVVYNNTLGRGCRPVHPVRRKRDQNYGDCGTGPALCTIPYHEDCTVSYHGRRR